MAVKPVCKRYGKELLDFGAILLSPPNDSDKVIKYRICKEGFMVISKELLN
ncbi:MAG: hypothetical protein AABW75_04525 [Nanoarchaeota archaeon]